MIRSSPTELCSSMMQALTKTPSSSPTFSTTMGGRLTPFHESGRYTPVTSTPVKERGSRESVAGSLERKAQTIPRRKISVDSRVFERDRKNQRQSTPTSGSLGRKISQTTATPGGQHVFIPPSVPPKMADWMPDQQVSKCVICSEKFSMVRCKASYTATTTTLTKTCFSSSRQYHNFYNATKLLGVHSSRQKKISHVFTFYMTSWIWWALVLVMAWLTKEHSEIYCAGADRCRLSAVWLIATSHVTLTFFDWTQFCVLTSDQ